MNKPVRSFPRPLSDLVGRCLGDVFAKQGFAGAELVTHWPDIVGPEIAAFAEPLKMQWPRGSAQDAPEPATLVLRAEGPAAIEVQHLSGAIIDRVNQFFGWRAVGRISLRQAPLAGKQPAQPARPQIDPARAAAEEERLRDIADAGLRTALGRLGAAVKQN
jgi:hypothetical protein